MKKKMTVKKEYINAIVEGWMADAEKRHRERMDDWLFEVKMESLGVEVKPC